MWKRKALNTGIMKIGIKNGITQLNREEVSEKIGDRLKSSAFYN